MAEWGYSTFYKWWHLSRDCLKWLFGEQVPFDSLRFGIDRLNVESRLPETPRCHYHKTFRLTRYAPKRSTPLFSHGAHFLPTEYFPLQKASRHTLSHTIMASYYFLRMLLEHSRTQISSSTPRHSLSFGLWDNGLFRLLRDWGDDVLSCFHLFPFALSSLYTLYDMLPTVLYPTRGFMGT